MSVIENFAELSVEEQKKFAEALIKKINSEGIFTSDANFEIYAVEADDLTGELTIEVSHGDTTLEVPREATWQAYDEDSISSDPDDADYVESIYNDAKKAFKTLSTTIDGYTVELEIADVDEVETIDVEVSKVSHEDSGIGHYEYWGTPGYDSHPYEEVEGTIIKACNMSLAFFVIPNDSTEIESEPEEI
jgi:hypothetical protein